MKIYSHNVRYYRIFKQDCKGIEFDYSPPHSKKVKSQGKNFGLWHLCCLSDSINFAINNSIVSNVARSLNRYVVLGEIFNCFSSDLEIWKIINSGYSSLRNIFLIQRPPNLVWSMHNNWRFLELCGFRSIQYLHRLIGN